MDTSRESQTTVVKKQTTAERKSERELIVRRTFDAPARIVFAAWSTPELFSRWWIPKSFGLSLISCEMDVRVGGKYRLLIARCESEPMAFFGTYLEVTAPTRLVWTNEEGEAGHVVTTVTLEEKGEQTLLVMTDLYPSQEALEAAMASGERDCVGETFDQLEQVLGGTSQS